ncbi:MAG: P-II family nitrogen regulator [Clostridiales bacterium]|nr:P-II family nitrogen regulator [Clostridiales bacterium]
MAALCRDTGLNLVLTNLGEGTATRQQLSRYGLDRTEKAVVSAVAGADARKRVFKAAKRRLSIDIPGNGILMAVPVKSVGGGRTLTYLTDSKVPNGGVPDMKFEYELIVAILNEGYADMVMDAARSAGAAGGTVLHARGTGAGETERFFSVSLAEEKDVIYIVSTGKEKAAIMRAISSQAGPETRAGAICFSLPVSSVAGLRRLDDDE